MSDNVYSDYKAENGAEVRPSWKWCPDCKHLRTMNLHPCLEHRDLKTQEPKAEDTNGGEDVQNDGLRVVAVAPGSCAEPEGALGGGRVLAYHPRPGVEGPPGEGGVAAVRGVASEVPDYDLMAAAAEQHISHVRWLESVIAVAATKPRDRPELWAKRLREAFDTLYDSAGNLGTIVLCETAQQFVAPEPDPELDDQADLYVGGGR